MLTLEQVQTWRGRATEHLSMPDDVSEMLRFPKETLSGTIRVRMDDGELRSFNGWRCRYNDVLGPTKGGIRFHPRVCLDELEALAFLMTIKCSLMGLRFGGAKGGVSVDATSLSTRELERLSRAYVREFLQILGPDRDIAAPDMYTNGRVMAWMADEYGGIHDRHSPAFITGKPIALAGTEGRTDATGRGAFTVFRELRDHVGLKKERARVVFLGFGNAAFHCARFFHENGDVIVGASDSSSAIFDPDGFDPDSVFEHKRQTGSLCGAPSNGNLKEISQEELIASDCDILVPAAVSNQITEDNAQTVSANVVLEVANGGVTPKGQDQLSSRDVITVPDILTNAGGVVVSYFEWTQNRAGRYWSAEEVEQSLEKEMVDATRRVRDASEEFGTDLRNGGYIVALRRICHALSEFGTNEYFET